MSLSPNRRRVASAPTAGNRRLLRRVVEMVVVWIFLGAFVGVASSPSNQQDPVALVAGAIAGMIVLPCLGAVLGLLGAEVKPVLLLALAGGVIGTLVGTASGRPDVLAVTSVGVIGGGIIGATASVLLRQARHLLGFALSTWTAR